MQAIETRYISYGRSVGRWVQNSSTLYCWVTRACVTIVGNKQRRSFSLKIRRRLWNLPARGTFEIRRGSSWHVRLHPRTEASLAQWSEQCCRSRQIRSTIPHLWEFVSSKMTGKKILCRTIPDLVQNHIDIAYGTFGRRYYCKGLNWSYFMTILW